MSSKPICYMSPEDALRFVMTRAQRPDPVQDNRDGIEAELPQGTRLDGPLFLEGTRHRAPNGRRLVDLQTRQGVHRPLPSGPPGQGNPRGRPGKGDQVDRWLLAKRRKQQKILRLAVAKMAAKLEKVTPAALRKREQRAKAKAKLAKTAA